MFKRIALVAVVGCIGGGAATSYTPEEDTIAMTSIVNTWSGDSLTLSLCEDLAAPDDENTCQIEHVVRGGGRGRRHTEEHGGVGCGGCPFGIAAIVKGTFSDGSMAAPVAVFGEVYLGVGEDDPYAFPFSFELQSADPNQHFVLIGTLHEDGTLELQRDYTGPIMTLARGAAATCPASP
jgi:hypothetical protein